VGGGYSELRRGASKGGEKKKKKIRVEPGQAWVIMIGEAKDEK